MTRQYVENFGSVGLNTDVHPPSLPPAAWTRLFNARTQDGAIGAVTGEQKLFDLDIKPVYHSVASFNGNSYVVVSDGAEIWCYDTQGIGTEITPTSGDWALGRVTFTNLNGILVVNSATDGPFYWPGALTPPADKLLPLPGWPSNYRCLEMAAYRYYLVALAPTQTVATVDYFYPHKVMWSNSAEEGAIPTEWLAALSNDAGDDLIGETPGYIVTSVLLRDSLIIVKEDAMYSMNWIGGSAVMQIMRLNGAVGTTMPTGVAEMLGGVVSFTSTDLLAFDGQSSKSIVDGIVRRGLSNSISSEFWESSVVFVHYPTSQIIVAGVGAGHTHLSEALVFNWEEKTWGHRQLFNAYGFDAIKVQVSSGYTWDELGTETPLAVEPGWVPGDPWDEQTNGVWNRGLYNPSVKDIIVYEANAEDTAWWISLIGISHTNSDGSPKTCVAERLGLPLENVAGLAMVTEMWPTIEGDIPVSFQVGGQLADGSAPYWGPTFVVTPGVTQSFCPRITGRFLCLRVTSNDPGTWRLAGLVLDHEPAGER